jgi:hypothetical protein
MWIGGLSVSGQMLPEDVIAPFCPRLKRHLKENGGSTCTSLKSYETWTNFTPTANNPIPIA